MATIGFLQLIVGFFTFWVGIGIKYRRIRDDETRRDSSIELGLHSIIQTILCAALAVGLAYATFFLIGLMDGEAMLLFIFLIAGILVCAVGAVITLVQGVIGGLIYMIYQFKLNKQPIRWVALVVWVLSVAGAAVGLILLLT